MAENGVAPGRRGCEDEILAGIRKKSWRVYRQRVVAEPDAGPQLGEFRRHVELKDRHFVIWSAGQVLEQMIGEIPYDVAYRIAAISVAVTRLTQLIEGAARQTAFPGP